MDPVESSSVLRYSTNFNGQLDPIALGFRDFKHFQHGGQRQLLNVVRVAAAAHNDAPVNGLDMQLPDTIAGSPRD
jgi:hypothetical protein